LSNWFSRRRSTVEWVISIACTFALCPAAAQEKDEKNPWGHGRERKYVCMYVCMYVCIECVVCVVKGKIDDM
jgi:hypothetical protein